MSDQFCLQCGYSLTGLSENRCPECGESFTAESIAVLTKRQMGTGRTALNIILPPLGATLLGLPVGLFMDRNTPSGLIPLYVIALMGFGAYTIYQCVRIARSMAINRAVRSGGRHPLRQAGSFVIGLGAALFCCELFLCGAGFFGGCAAGFLTQPHSFH